MEMTTCHYCGKIYGSTGDSLCGKCRRLADIVYERARTYIRDNPKGELDPKALAEAIGEDERLIDILMLEGRFTGDPDDAAPIVSPEERKRQQLLSEFQKNITGSARERRAAAGTYGSNRHGRGAE